MSPSIDREYLVRRAIAVYLNSDSKVTTAGIAYNLKLSWNTAQIVKRALIEKGILDEAGGIDREKAIEYLESRAKKRD